MDQLNIFCKNNDIDVAIVASQIELTPETYKQGRYDQNIVQNEWHLFSITYDMRKNPINRHTLVIFIATYWPGMLAWVCTLLFAFPCGQNIFHCTIGVDRILFENRGGPKHVDESLVASLAPYRTVTWRGSPHLCHAAQLGLRRLESSAILIDIIIKGIGHIQGQNNNQQNKCFYSEIWQLITLLIAK